MGSGFLPSFFGAIVRLQFGDCTLEGDTREIVRRGRPVHLEPKAYRLLELLLEARPKALSKVELQDALWPDTYVSELALSRLVSVLRSALGDSTSKPRLIRTVHGFGYAFVGETAAAKPGARDRTSGSDFHCRIAFGGREIALDDGEHVIGRDPSSDVWVDRKSVSRRHARIVVSRGQATLEDLGSRNGTFVEKRRVERPVRLADGNRIKVGSTRIVFRRVRGFGSTQSEGSSEIG